MKPRRYTIAEVAGMAAECDIVLLYGQFLDGFYCASDEEKRRLVADAPDPSLLDGRWRAQLAAVAHRLANLGGFEPPSWVFDGSYAANGVFYAFGAIDEDDRRFLERTTPAEFRQRGLMYGGNVMDRT